MSIPEIEQLRHFCHIKVKSSQSIHRRITDYYDFTFVLSGRLIFTVDGKVYKLGASDAVFIPPGTLYERTALAEPCEYVSFNFTTKDRLPFGVFEKSCITPTIRDLINIYPASHMYDREGATREKCLCILNYILLELHDNLSSRKSVYITKITDYISEHITEPMSLSTVSLEVNLSKEYCAAIFKAETGKTVNEYINEQKMFLARSLIKNREMPLCDISEYLGYNNYNYFCRVFKKTFGIPPTKIK